MGAGKWIFALSVSLPSCDVHHHLAISNMHGSASSHLESQLRFSTYRLVGQTRQDDVVPPPAHTRPMNHERPVLVEQPVGVEAQRLNDGCVPVKAEITMHCYIAKLK